MTTFDDRESAFENKFAHDAEMQFRVQARTAKNLALWAAGLMGHADDKAVEYASAFMGRWLAQRGDAVALCLADLKATGATADEAEVSRQAALYMSRAKADLAEGIE